MADGEQRTPGKGDQREELSEARTDLAEDRTGLANERTFASWMRTGFAAVGIGLGFHALFLQMQPWWVPRLIATAFFLTGMYVVISAERRATAVHRRLHEHKVKTVRNSRMQAMTVVTCAAVLALVAALWSLPLGSAGR